MARRSTLDNILEAVSADNSLQEALLGRLMSGANENDSFSSQHVSCVDHPPRITPQSLPCFPAFGMQMCQSGLNAPVVTQMCQLGRVTPLVTQMCQSGSTSTSLVMQMSQSRSVTPLVTQMCQTGSASLWTTSMGQPGSGNVLEASMPSLVKANTSDDTIQVGVCDPNGREGQGGNQ